MYSRYPNYRFSGAMRVPDNYSGNAFNASESSSINEERELPREEAPPIESVAEQPSEPETVEASKPIDKKFRLPAFNLDIGRLFSGKFGIEELLIIGLILLISKNDTDDDIILLLALLLFIG